MKVCVLGTRGCPNIQGGVEKHCEELYPKLVEQGCDITVFARKPYMLTDQRICKWKGVRSIWLWAPHHKYLEAFCHTFLGVISARIKSPDILHLHAIGPSLLIPLAKILGLKVVMTHHGPDYRRQKWGRFAKFALQLGEYVAIRYAERVIVIAKTVKDDLEKKYGRMDLEYIPNGVDFPQDISNSGMLRRYDLTPKKYVLAVSRFVPEKGLHDLIQAYSKVTNPGFKLVIAGDADHETDYSRNIKKSAKASNDIILTGFISGRPLQQLFSNAGLFVHVSHYEGLPISLLEALSYGLNVLVSDIPAHKEIPLADFRYSPVGNIDVLSKKIVALFGRKISDEEIRLNKKTLLDNYNWNVIAKKTMRVYNGIFENRS